MVSMPSTWVSLVSQCAHRHRRRPCKGSSCKQRHGCSLRYVHPKPPSINVERGRPTRARTLHRRRLDAAIPSPARTSSPTALLESSDMASPATAPRGPLAGAEVNATTSTASATQALEHPGAPPVGLPLTRVNRPAAGRIPRPNGIVAKREPGSLRPHERSRGQSDRAVPGPPTHRRSDGQMKAAVAAEAVVSDEQVRRETRAKPAFAFARAWEAGTCS